MVTAAPLAMIVLWGPDLIQIYNDAYAAICGARHPKALGQPTRDCWPEVWDFNAPIYQAVMRGEARSFPQQLLQIERAGTMTDAWFDLTYSPLVNEAGDYAGVLVTVVETTHSVVAQRRLDDRTTRQRRLFDQSPGFIRISRGPEHVYEFANRAYERLVGRQNLVGKTVRDGLPDIAGQGFYELLDKVYATGERHVARGVPVSMVRTPGGLPEERHIDFVYEPVVDETGRVTGVFTQGQDVTDAYLARCALIESESRLRDLNNDLLRQVKLRTHALARTWDINPDLLGVANGDGYFESSNPAWMTLLGWSEAEIAATPLFAFVHPDDLDKTYTVFEGLKAGEPALHFENRYRMKEGGYRWLSWVAVPDDGKFYCNAHDITAEKSQAAELAERTADRDRIWKNSRDVLVVASAEGVFRAVSPAWTRILGYKVEETVGRSYEDFLWPEDAESTRQAVAITVSNGDLPDFENRYRHKDGTPRWISWKISFEVDTIYAYARDVTLEKARAEELIGVEERLRQSQKMEAVGQLTGGIAHDFNNMLTGIIGGLDIVRKRLVSGRLNDIERFMDAASESALRAAGLTHRLLSFSRRQTLNSKTIDINALALSMEDMLRRTLGETVRLEMAFAADLWLAKADAGQLENALLNLCLNARDAMPNGGTLTVETNNIVFDEHYTADMPDLEPGDFVVLTVSDTGQGIPQEILRRVFEPFFTTKKIGEGTGLGLSMVYGFAKQSHGHVDIYSEPGRGAAVKLFLPRAPDLGGVVVVPEVRVLQRAWVGETVMVVEDEPSVRLLITEVLHELGYAFVQAGDSETALPILRSSQRIDLLVTDVGLPGMNGRELADLARGLRPDLKILFVTAYSENAAVREAFFDAGMDLLTKPFTVDALGARIRAIIESNDSVVRQN
jgi:PAS domain S-box-containing protein